MGRTIICFVSIGAAIASPHCREKHCLGATPTSHDTRRLCFVVPWNWLPSCSPEHFFLYSNFTNACAPCKSALRIFAVNSIIKIRERASWKLLVTINDYRFDRSKNDNWTIRQIFTKISHTTMIQCTSLLSNGNFEILARKKKKKEKVDSEFQNSFTTSV